MLSSMVKDSIDILMVLETRLASSFPQVQFRIEGYTSPFRYDRNSYDVDILLFIREDIPTKIISITPLKGFEGIFVELNFRKIKILLCCSYNPDKNLISIISYLISEMTESAMENCCGTNHLHNLIKDPTCFKNPDKPSCIYLLLTNFPKSLLK